MKKLLLLLALLVSCSGEPATEAPATPPPAAATSAPEASPEATAAAPEATAEAAPTAIALSELRGVVCTPIQSAGSVDNRRYWGKIATIGTGAEVAKQADALRSGRSGSIPMWVQIPPSALLFKHIAWSFGRAIFL